MTSGARSQRTHAALEHFGRPVPLICLLSPSDKLSSHRMTLQRSYDLSDPGWLSSADYSGGDEECVRALLLTSQLEILTYLYWGGGLKALRDNSGANGGRTYITEFTWNQMENTSVASVRSSQGNILACFHWLISTYIYVYSMSMIGWGHRLVNGLKISPWHRRWYNKVLSKTLKNMRETIGSNRPS